MTMALNRKELKQVAELTVEHLANNHRVVWIDGNVVRELRLAAGMTQADLTRLGGFSEKFLAKVEGRVEQHRLAAILTLAKALGVDPVEIEGVPVVV